jgi:uncharacterized protein (DUF58 family)
LKLTRAGSIYIGATLLLGFAAVNTGNNLLYLLVSLLLGFMAMTGLFGRSNLSRLQVMLEPPDELFADQPTLARVRLANQRRRLPGFLLEVACNGQTVLFPLIPACSEAIRSIELQFPRRGAHLLPEVTLQSGFPVNFFRRRFRFRPDGTAVVFPAPLPCDNPADDRAQQSAGTAFARQSGQDGELRAISDYRGEPLKAIHWKLSARQDELKVKQHAGLSQPPVLIDLAQLPGGLERRLSHASHLVMMLSRDNRPIGLRLPGTTIAAGNGRLHRQRLLKELALHAEA